MEGAEGQEMSLRTDLDEQERMSEESRQVFIGQCWAGATFFPSPICSMSVFTGVVRLRCLQGSNTLCVVHHTVLCDAGHPSSAGKGEAGDALLFGREDL